MMIMKMKMIKKVIYQIQIKLHNNKVLIKSNQKILILLKIISSIVKSNSISPKKMFPINIKIRENQNIIMKFINKKIKLT